MKLIAYSFLDLFDRYLLSWLPARIILGYHSLAESDNKYAVPLSTFKQHIDILLTRGFVPVTLSQIADFVAGRTQLPRRCFAVTFDDGYASVSKTVKFLSDRHIRPTLFLPAQFLHSNQLHLSGHEPLLTFRQVKTLMKSGWEIGCHSSTHTDFSRLDKLQLVAEISTAKTRLEILIGQPVRFFAYPRGIYTPQIIRQVAASNYQLALSVNSGGFTEFSNPYILPRIGLENWVVPDIFIKFISRPACLIRRLVSPYYV